MKLISSVFVNKEAIPVKYSADGEGVNPPLEFSEVPEQAKSLALIVDDPDAPNGDFVHWVVWNIDPKFTGIAENSVPTGARVGVNSRTVKQWIPPRPPSGTHRYFFKLYALNIDLNISEDTDKYQLITYMDNHILAQAELIGLYSRGK